MIDYAVEVGAAYLFVSEIRPGFKCQETWNRLTLDGIKESAEFKKIIDSAIEHARAKNLRINFNFRKTIQNQHKKNICIAPWEHVFIDCKGNVSSCCEAIVNVSFGNLNEQSFTSIWNGESINKFRSDMAEGKYNSICKNCCLSWGITHD